MQPINQAANAMILPMVVAVFNLPAGVNMPAAMQWQTYCKLETGTGLSPIFLPVGRNFRLATKLLPKIDANVARTL